MIRVGWGSQPLPPSLCALRRRVTDRRAASTPLGPNCGISAYWALLKNETMFLAKTRLISALVKKGALDTEP